MSSLIPSSSGGEPVYLYVYDLSQGMARSLSPMFLGRTIDAIYHTGLVVFGYEYYYGGGIQAGRPGQTAAGQPMQKIALGSTALSQEAFHEFLRAESHRFTPETYDLFTHNCNNFSSDCAKYLLGGRDIPAHITGLPAEVLNTPIGQMMAPMITGMQGRMRDSFASQAGGGGIGLVPWQESGLTSSHASLLLPPISSAAQRAMVAAAAGSGAVPLDSVTNPNAVTANSTPAAAAASAASPVAPATAAVTVAPAAAATTMPAVSLPAGASSHGALALLRAGPAAAAGAAATLPAPSVDARVLPSMGVLVKASLRKPAVAADPARAVAGDEAAAVAELLLLLGKVPLADWAVDVVEGALPPLASAVLASPAADGAAAALPRPLPAVARLAELVTTATSAATATATATAGAASPAAGADMALGPKVVTVALQTLLNFALLPSLSSTMAADPTLLEAATRCLSAHPHAPARAAAAELLHALARAALPAPAARTAAPLAAAESEATALSEPLSEVLIAAVALLNEERDAAVAAAALALTAELCLGSGQACVLAGDLDLDLAGIWARSAASPVARELCRDLAAMVALAQRYAE